MYRDNKTGQLVFSPSDLARFWESEFSAWMDRYDLEFPGILVPDATDGMSKVLQKKGYDHEEATIKALEAKGRKVYRIDPESKAARQDTIDAMKRGEDIIFQARLESTSGAHFRGWADFLVRVEGNSELGDYHYEVWDTKLARKLKPYFILQLATYADMLQGVQGIIPKNIAVVLGDGKENHLRLNDYYYYYLSVKDSFLRFQKTFDADNRPDPEKYRSYGKWETEAQNIMEAQDALIQVAGISTTQIKNLKAAGIMTMTQLAQSEKVKIPKMGEQVFSRAKIQARLQLESAGNEIPSYIIRSDNEKAGLYLLPAASDGDLYFDIEGFPLVEGGLEYLWGNTYVEKGERKFRDFWAHNQEQEKKAFEDFIDWVHERWKKDPKMHVYHYASYEITVLRRLMGRYASREDEVDQLLRNGVFVDLFAIVRHGLFVGEPRYSIKNIEHLYRGRRQGAVTDGGASVEFYENWRTAPDGETHEDSAILKAIRDYNIDDCDSTLELAEWLRGEQKKAKILPFSAKERKEAPESLDEELPELVAKLKVAAEKFPEAKILIQLIDFYRREAKPGWWKFFDRQASLPDELYDDPECLTGLVAITDTEPHKRTKLRRVYEYDPDQDVKLQTGADCVHHFDETLHVSVGEIDYEQGYIELFGSSPECLPDGLTIIPIDSIRTQPLARSVIDFCRSWLTEPERKNAVSDFLNQRPPRIKNLPSGHPIISENTGIDDFIPSLIDTVLRMDHTMLCIQGPPGTGKTYTAEHIIGALVAKGYRVGVTSNSHKAINNLLIRTARLCDKEGIVGGFVKVNNNAEPEIAAESRIAQEKSASRISFNSNLKVIGGTAWAFAAPDLKDKIDYLFVDEAGQVSIANLVAMSRSCKNIVVMGDQMQLSQPIKGSHPGESGQSVLDYYLHGHATIPENLGVFLPLSYRMHPAICSFISGAVYEDRLQSAPHCAKQKLDIKGSKYLKTEAGITFVPVTHDGNSQVAEEEISEIKLIFQDLVGRDFHNSEGKQQTLTEEDILVVAPYNMQVRRLQEALGERAQVGSVDKFQGQEAPVVILSMCTSDAASSHRGIDFIFSKNRLNVAVSRAQIAAIVVGHPNLVTTFASSPDHITKVNMFCRLVAVRPRMTKKPRPSCPG